MGLVLVFFESLGLGLGLGLGLSPYPKTQKNKHQTQIQAQKSKEAKFQTQTKTQKNTKIFGFKKKSEKIYSLKYLDINEIFLKPKNFWVLGFSAFFRVLGYTGKLT
jgi:hypothetical protein